MLRPLGPLALALLLAACAAETPTPPPEAAPPVEAVEPSETGPAGLEASPGDTTGTAEARAFADRLDAAFRQATSRSARLPNPIDPGGEPRVLGLYEGADGARRLDVTEPTDSGAMTGRSQFYLDGAGALVYVRGPFAQYAFHRGRLVAWMDENGRPLTDVAERDRAARETALAEEARTYLAAVGG